MRKIRTPEYELQDLLGKHIEGQFYDGELSPVHVRKRANYALDKKLRKRVRRGILEYLVRWRRYNSDFDSWIPASSIKNDRRSKPL